MILSLKTEEFDKSLLEKYKGRMVGYVIDGCTPLLLVTMSYAKKGSIPIGKGGLNPIIFKCRECGNDMADNELAIPGRVMAVDAYNGNIVDRDYKIGYHPLYALTICPKCEEKRMLQIASRLWCRKCDKQFAWFEAGELKKETAGLDFIVEAGKTYYIDDCPKCVEGEKVNINSISEVK